MWTCLGLVDARAMVSKDLLTLSEDTGGRVSTARIAIGGASRVVLGRVPHSTLILPPDSATAPPPTAARSPERGRERKKESGPGAPSWIDLN